jgi:hypothetical protein
MVEESLTALRVREVLKVLDSELAGEEIFLDVALEDFEGRRV